MMMPPMPFPPPGMYGPPPRQRGSVGRVLATAVATAIVVFSLGANLLFLLVMAAGAASMRGAEPVIEREVAAGNRNEKIAVLPVGGVIDAEMRATFDNLIERVEKDDDVRGVVVWVDSPGGGVTESDQIYNRIRRFKTDMAGRGRSVPVVVSMGSLATSGGYYVACAADHIVAERTCLTGNIGVLMPRYNVHELFDKWGVRETTVTSSGTDFKNAGSMFQPENPRDTAYIQELADGAFAVFKQVVAQGRQSKLTKPLDEIANGKVYIAADALTLGLIDQVGGVDAAVAHVQQVAGLANPSVVHYAEPEPLFQGLGVASELLSPRASAGDGGVTINGVNVTLDRSALYELTTPRLMYLWQGQ